MAQSPWMTAAAAAARLGVSRATLYAYVSRGRIRSQAVAGRTRERQYARDDIERLHRRADERKHPDHVAARSLDWGLPVLESAIALIDGHRLYYRGHDAIALAEERTFEEVMSLVWTGQFGAARFRGTPPRGWLASGPSAPRALPFIARAQRALAAAAVVDPAAFDTRPEAVVRCGDRILRALVQAATLRPVGDDTPDAALARAWRLAQPAADLIGRVLVLCADHELNVSSFTARCAASAGASPYGAVIAALAALEGPKHGGASARAEALLQGLRGERSLRPALSARLQRGEGIDGFGHPLYPDGDPRAVAMLGWLRASFPRAPELRFVQAVARAASAVMGEPPNLDFALASAARVLRLPTGAPLMLFAIGRTVGWIGHALEQYASGQLIRPRAKYVGVTPGPACASTG